MSSKNKITGTLAAFAVVALMAGPAIAGKPLNVIQKKALADAKAQQALSQQAGGQPIVSSDGSPAVVVPDELYNYMHAQKDAQGNVRVLETDGDTAPAKIVEVTNE